MKLALIITTYSSLQNQHLWPQLIAVYKINLYTYDHNLYTVYDHSLWPVDHISYTVYTLMTTTYKISTYYNNFYTAHTENLERYHYKDDGIILHSHNIVLSSINNGFVKQLNNFSKV